MTPVSAHHVAAALTQEALGAVFDPAAVAVLREDSPLSALGFTDADMVCVTDALADAAGRQGLKCVLDDADVADVASVFDLITAVMARLAEPEAVS